MLHFKEISECKWTAAIDILDLLVFTLFALFVNQIPNRRQWAVQ